MAGTCFLWLFFRCALLAARFLEAFLFGFAWFGPSAFLEVNFSLKKGGGEAEALGKAFKYLKRFPALRRFGPFLFFILH